MNNGEIMHIDNILDWEQRLNRQDACFDGAVLDRPVVIMSCSKPESKPFPLNQKQHSSIKERWYDAEYQAQKARHRITNTLYFGDALPMVFPDLGPDFFPSLFGGKIEFEETTSYIRPCLDEWEEWDDKIKYDENGESFLKMEELYEAYFQELKGVGYVGYPDLHPGSDCLVGFRGPMNMNLDVIEYPDEIIKGLSVVTHYFFKNIGHYLNKLRIEKQPCSAWPGIVSRYEYHVPSTDFSYMISPNSFNQLFLEGLREENRHFEKNIHHLDGPGCKNHLESLLDIGELDMIQWVWGAGNGKATDYLDLYQQIQRKGKGIQTWVDLEELDTIIEHLNPEGIWMRVHINNSDEAEKVMKKIEKWTRSKIKIAI